MPKVTYLSDFTGDSFILVVSNGRCMLLAYGRILYFTCFITFKGFRRESKISKTYLVKMFKDMNKIETGANTAYSQ